MIHTLILFQIIQLLNNNAKYDWIAFLDSDDLWNLNKLEIINLYIMNNKNCNYQKLSNKLKNII